MSRSRWAAVGAAVAVCLGAGTIGITHATEPAGAVTYVPITPCRLLDSRPAPDNVGNRNTPIGAGQTHTVSAHGNNGNCTGIPAGATGLQLNITALNASIATFLTIWPTGATKPFTANLNPTPGEPPTPNSVTTGISVGGQFDIFNNSGTVDVVVDVFGYYINHSHTGADIVDESLESVDIKNNTVTNVDTQNEPGIAENFFDVATAGANVPTSAGTVSIRVPSNGYVVVQVTGEWAPGTAAATDTVRCQLQKGAAVAIDTAQPWWELNDRNSATQAFSMFSAHRILPISVADNPLLIFNGQTLGLTCDEITGNATFDNVHISATFFASEYEPGLIFIPFAETNADGAPAVEDPAPASDGDAGRTP